MSSAPLPFIEDQFDQLRELRSLEVHNLSPDDGGYTIVPKVHPSWFKTERRMLFVIESMDINDIKGGKLFTSRKAEGRSAYELNAIIATVRNTLKQSWKLYQEYLGRNSLTDTPLTPGFSIGFVNFNALKYFHYKGAQRTNALMKCARRVTEIVSALEPTDVVIFGDTATQYLVKDPMPQVLPWKRGWVLDTKIGEHPCRVVPTLDLEPLYNASGDEDDDNDDASGPADLLYFVCRNLTNAYAGKKLHSLEHVNPKIVMIDTIAKFDKLFAKLMATGPDHPIGWDMETATLEAVSNKILTVQIAFDTSRGFMIPMYHKDTPFNEEELAYIHRKLKGFLSLRSESKRRQLVGANIQFDMKVCRGQFGIPVIYHYLWDVAAGEMLIDENIALFDRMKFRVGTENVKVTMGNLRALATHYGNDLYWRIAFSKGERHTFHMVDIMKDRDAQFYGVLDACIVLGIREEQIKVAEKTRLSPKTTYERHYVRHVSRQMSNICHGISMMQQNGSHLDLPYMAHLSSKDSPLLKVMRETEAELRSMKTVDEANKRLCAQNGVRAKGLFKQKIDLFALTKGDGLHQLFFGVLGLKPLKLSKETGKPSIDRAFLNEYAPLFPEVGLVKDWRAAQKLVGTYVKSWADKAQKAGDSFLDHCLRASFSFFLVTGRLNSFDPNLQQVPSRGKSAKIIKEAFRARRGRLNFAWDFNAAEVRMAACLSGDTKLRDAFLAGLDLRRQLIQEMDPEKRKAIIKLIKTEGDIHVRSVHAFFGMWVDKDHPLRAAVKAVVFGVLYGKSPATLAKDLQGEARYRHRDIILAAQKRVRTIQAQIKALTSSSMAEQEEEA